MLTPNVIQLRGTIFLPVVIGYSSDNAERYSSLLSGALVQPVQPTAIIPIAPIGLQINQEVSLQDNGPWQMVSGNTRIVFFQNKIDIIQDVITPMGTSENNFCVFCAEKFSRILELEATTSNRIAFAPTYAKDPDDSFKSADFWNLVLTHASFDGSNIEEVNVTCNRKVDKLINGNPYTINFRSVLSDAKRNLPSWIVLGGSVMISFDINTAIIPGTPYIFRAAEINDFFTNAVVWSNEFFAKTLA